MKFSTARGRADQKQLAQVHIEKVLCAKCVYCLPIYDLHFKNKQIFESM